MSDSDSEASTAAAAERVPATPEEVEKSNELKTQANKKFQENHHNEAIDLYTKQVPHPSWQKSFPHYGARLVSFPSGLMLANTKPCPSRTMAHGPGGAKSLSATHSMALELNYPSPQPLCWREWGAIIPQLWPRTCAGCAATRKLGKI